MFKLHHKYGTSYAKLDSIIEFTIYEEYSYKTKSNTGILKILFANEVKKEYFFETFQQAEQIAEKMANTVSIHAGENQT